MKIRAFYNLVKVLYKRNFTKNTMIIIFMLVINLVFGFYAIFKTSEAYLLKTLSQSYYEHLSVDVSFYESTNTSNALINVKKYKRPSIDHLYAFTDYTERLIVRPDFTKILANATLSCFDKSLPLPQFVVVNSSVASFGINRTFLDIINENINNSSESLALHFALQFTITENDELIQVEYNDTLPIDFIFEEPAYFSAPKLYIPQEYIDQHIGSLFLFEGVTLNNYLFNIHSEHELSNYKFRVHFQDVAQKEKFMTIVSSSNTREEGIEVSSDEIFKVASFNALFSYLNILAQVFLVFIIIGSLVMHGIVAHTSLLALQKQMALLNIIGAQKIDLLILFLLLSFINFIIGLASLFLLPSFLPIFSYVFLVFLKINLKVVIDYSMLLLMVLSSGLILLLLLISLFLINMRRPLLYLLIDA